MKSLTSSISIVIAILVLAFLSGCNLAAESWDDPVSGEAVFNFEPIDLGLVLEESEATWTLTDEAFDEENLNYIDSFPGADDYIVSACPNQDTLVIFFADNLSQMGVKFNISKIADIIMADANIASFDYIHVTAYANCIVVEAYDPDVSVHLWAGIIDYIEKIAVATVYNWRFE